MLIVQTGKNLSRTCISVRRLPCSSQMQPILLISKRSKTTEKCEEPKKPPPRDRCGSPANDKGKPRSRKLFKIAGIALAGSALAVVAAKNDDDFRDWTKKNFPSLDSLVKVVYKEEETYPQFLQRAYKELTEWLKNGLYSVVHGIKESGKRTRDAIEEPPEDIKVMDVFKLPDSAFAIEDKKDDKGSSQMKVPANMKHLKVLEDTLFKDAQVAMQAYSSATLAMKEKANLIDNLDQLVGRHDSKLWDKLKKRSEDEKKFSEKFDTGIERVEMSAENLRFQMDRTPELTLDVKQKAESNISYAVGTVNKAKENLNKDRSNLTLAKRSWDKVRMARMYFSEQLETLFPNVWLNDEKLNLQMDNLPPFIENVTNDILYMQKDLNKFMTIREPEVNYAVEVAKKGDLEEMKEPIVEAFVNIESGQEKRLRLEELQKALLEKQAKCEKGNRESMKKLAEVYNDLKTKALIIREREVERRMIQQLDERLAQLRATHQLEMAKLVGRVQGANEAIALRGDKEKVQQVKQQFWSAAQSLLSAVKPIGVGDKPTAPKPLKNEITNVTKAAPDGDELVKSVVSTIPPVALEQGVVSEECLKQRFLQVEKQARHLAGVPSGPITLFQLALARLQSALYLDLPIPQPELNNEPINVEELNNYQILQRARYYVDNRELGQAVRYLNLLKGPSRKVVSDWIKDVVVYLETVQAAELLLGHASAFN